MIPIFIISMIVFNTIGFLLVRIDKKKGEYISWFVYTIVGVLGGAAGILIAMLLYRHKISQLKYLLPVAIALILNIVVTIMVFAPQLFFPISPATQPLNSGTHTLEPVNPPRHGLI